MWVFPFPTSLDDFLSLSLFPRSSPRPRDAARLACVCTRLHGIVRNRSRWPFTQEDGTVLPPLSGLYHVTVDPAGGWAGLVKALAFCPKGGSVHFLEGEYLYGPGDLTEETEQYFYHPPGPIRARKSTAPCTRHFYSALPLERPIHLFGHGKASFKPTGIPFNEWGGGYQDIYCILAEASRITLDGLVIAAPPGTCEDHSTYGVGVLEETNEDWNSEVQGARVQSCTITAPAESGGSALRVIYESPSRPSRDAS